MPRAKNSGNGKVDKLGEAMTALIQAQAISVQNQAAFVAEIRDLERQIAERFARIESILLDHSRILAEHSRILADHGRILQGLTDAIREKIGFKAAPPSS